MEFAPHLWQRPAGTSARPAIFALCILLATTIPLHSAAAQLSGSITLSSEARLRGRAVSEHRPVAELQLLHDSVSGLYLGGSAGLVATHDAGLQPLSFTGYAGLVRRISPSAALDVGFVHSGYTEYSAISGGGSYSEAYVGMTSRHLSARLFLSPAYFRRNEPTLYAEVNGKVDLSRDWTLSAHVGRLTYLRDHPYRSHGAASDWRIGVRRQVGRVSLDAAWTGYIERKRSYDAPGRNGNAMVAALSLAF